MNVYVEYTNEPWHTGFAGGQYAQLMGTALNMTVQGASWYGGVANEQRLCFVGNRTRVISTIFKARFGAAASRVKVVVQTQFSWTIVTSKLLSCGNTSAFVDAVGVGYGSILCTVSAAEVVAGV